MKIIDKRSILPRMFFARPIKIGKNSIYFKTIDGMVCKLFLDNRYKNNYEDTLEYFEKLDEVGNNTYISPEVLIVDDNNIIGYLYPYARGKSLNNLSINTSIDSILDSYYDLASDTKSISRKKFVIDSLNNTNIIYDNDKFHVVNLDDCVFLDNGKNLFQRNLGGINRSIIYSLFGSDDNAHFMFNNDYIEELYIESIYSDPYQMYNLLDSLLKNGLKDKYDCMKDRKLTRTNYKVYYKG